MTDEQLAIDNVTGSCRSLLWLWSKHSPLIGAEAAAKHKAGVQKHTLLVVVNCAVGETRGGLSAGETRRNQAKPGETGQNPPNDLQIQF